jgi:anti-anti-sigma factor
MAMTPEASGSEEELARRVGEADRVRQAFEALPVMAFGIEGSEFRYTAVNAVFRSALGRGEVIGTPLADAFADLVGQQIVQTYQEVYTTGKPLVLHEYRTQIRPEGSDAEVEKYFDVVMVPMRDPDGTITGIAGTGNDVTAAVRRRQAVEQEAGEVRRRYERARDVIGALQRELLPAGVPVLPGVHIAASYLLADADTAAGGDWFDALPLPDGRVALVVGDVVGHGVAASAVMGQLRVVLHERLAATGDLLEAIRATDRIASAIPGARAATLCAAVLDPGTGALSYCTAGHPPPLLLSPGGEPRYLPASGSGPLGVGGDFALAGERLAPDDLVLLFTDGILERPGRGLPAATVELAQVAADVAADRALRDTGSTAERVAGQTLELLTRVTGHSDDITLLAAQRAAAPPELHIEAAADFTALAGLRRELAQWLAAAGVADDDVTILQHALGELAANAAEHAYAGDDNGIFTLTADLTSAGELRAEVRDHGRWREPQPGEGRGLGLTLAANLTGGLHLEHGERGTTATISYPLVRPARLLTDGVLGYRPPTPAAPGLELFLILDQPSAPRPRVRVDGPVDGHSAPALERHLQQATSAGTRALTLDLTGVTQLASAGVAALHRVARQCADQGTALRLYAPPGSPAQMILSLVQLGHVTIDPDY